MEASNFDQSLEAGGANDFDFPSDLQPYNDDLNMPPEYQSGGATVEQRDEYVEEDEENMVIPGVNDLPLFATAEARKIDLDNKAKEAEIEKVISSIQDLEDRVKIMKDHFRNVQQEVEHTNALLGAKKSEMHTEEHLTQLTSRTLGRAQHESRKIREDISLIQELINSVQNQIHKENDRMDEFKMQMNWNQEELEKWVIASKQKEEDNMALEKYTKADDLKIKEKAMQLEFLTKELVAKRTALENEVSETQAKQVELDRLAIDFRDLHKERQVLIQRWQETIEEMKSRDKSINELGERFAVAKTERAKKEALLEAAKKRYEAQLKENVEVESRSEMLSRVVSKKREDMINISKRLADFRDELESLKGELSSSAETLVHKRSENANKLQDLDERKVVLERQRQKYQIIKEKLASSKTQNFKAEETAKQAEDELNRLEKDFEKQVLLLKGQEIVLTKETQKLHDIKAEETRLTAAIIGSKSTFKSMDASLHTLDKESAKQQELLYNAEFQIQQIERKIARGMGERSDEEKRDLKKRIDDLEAEVETVTEKRKILIGQGRKLANELATSKTRREQLTEKERLKKESLAEIELQNRMIEEEIRRETRVKEELVVNNDLLRLEVRRLRDLLSAKADAVFSLENRKQQLELSLAERKEEIKVHLDVLRAELRVGNEEKHKVTMELRNREANVEKLRSRFEAVTKAKGSNDEGHSQAYYVILAAQKREALQRRGDELDYDVRKAEKEIRALQTTLDHLNARNKAYRASFQKVELDGDDVEVLKQLEERTKLAKDALFKKKKELQRLVTDAEEDSRRLQNIKAQDGNAARQHDHLQNAKAQIEEELLNQQAQLSEFVDRIDKLVDKHRQKSAETLLVDISSFANGTIEEKAVKAEVLKDVTQNVLYTLGQLSGEFPETADYLMSKIREADLKMPAKPPSRGGGPRIPPSSGGSRPGSSSVARATRNFDIEV